tara:strand:- start:2103 stop:2366 length:264 start_codon:yes stop_codon:yes gene_type:complete
MIRVTDEMVLDSSGIGYCADCEQEVSQYCEPDARPEALPGDDETNNLQEDHLKVEGTKECNHCGEFAVHGLEALIEDHPDIVEVIYE